MKSIDEAYLTAEEETKMKVAELYRIWWTGRSWYYTSGDVNVTYNSNTYIPATIKRGLVRYDSRLELSTLEVNFGRTFNPIRQYIASNPVEVIWIEVLRIHRDASPVTASVVFIGQIKSVGIQGMGSQATCVGFEFYLQQVVPIERYGPQCNWQVFDTKCTLADTTYKVNASAYPNSTKLTLTSSTFSTKEDGYFTKGWVEWGYHRRMITNHVGSVITLRYPMSSMTPGYKTVTAYPGCDGHAETCRDKYSNIANFGGHPYIPLDNPTTWD